MDNSRTTNSIKNAKSGLIVQLINKIIAFIVRTIFIKYLNIQYLGVNSLFTNILTLLSFAELGVGTAIIFSMYKPVVKDDKEKLKSLLCLYKKSYNTIGIIVFILGLLVIPFLKYIVKDVPNIKESIYLIYILFLINTSISYFFTYKRSIISAYQQERVINYISTIIKSIACLLQIVCLLLFHNYLVFLVIMIIDTIIENIAISKKADKMFPFLKEKNIKPLPKNEVKSIFDNVKSLVVYKVGSIVLDGTDNIIMSTMINVSMVGMASNYTLIVVSIKSVLFNVLNSITASVGNLNSGSNIQKKEDIFHQLTFLNYLIYSFISIGLIIMLNPLINLWLGKNYLLSFYVSFILGINLLIEGLRLPAYTYRVTLGLFNEGKLTPFIATIVNIFSSIILCHYFGLIGIFIGTGLAQVLSYSWMDPNIIYKYEFKKTPVIYYKKMLTYILVFILNFNITNYIISLIFFKNIVILFIVRLIIITIVSNIINLLIFYKSNEFFDIKNKLLKKYL